MCVGGHYVCLCVCVLGGHYVCWGGHYVCWGGGHYVCWGGGGALCVFGGGHYVCLGGALCVFGGGGHYVCLGGGRLMWGLYMYVCGGTLIREHLCVWMLGGGGLSVWGAAWWSKARFLLVETIGACCPPISTSSQSRLDTLADVHMYAASIRVLSKL